MNEELQHGRMEGLPRSKAVLLRLSCPQKLPGELVQDTDPDPACQEQADILPFWGPLLWSDAPGLGSMLKTLGRKGKLFSPPYNSKMEQFEFEILLGKSQSLFPHLFTTQKDMMQYPPHSFLLLLRIKGYLAYGSIFNHDALTHTTFHNSLLVNAHFL